MVVAMGTRFVGASNSGVIDVKVLWHSLTPVLWPCPLTPTLWPLSGLYTGLMHQWICLYFKSMMESGVTSLNFRLKECMHTFHQSMQQMDCRIVTMETDHTTPQPMKVRECVCVCVCVCVCWGEGGDLRRPQKWCQVYSANSNWPQLIHFKGKVILHKCVCVCVCVCVEDPLYIYIPAHHEKTYECLWRPQRSLSASQLLWQGADMIVNSRTLYLN